MNVFMSVMIFTNLSNNENCMMRFSLNVMHVTRIPGISSSILMGIFCWLFISHGGPWSHNWLSTRVSTITPRVSKSAIFFCIDVAPFEVMYCIRLRTNVSYFAAGPLSNAKTSVESQNTLDCEISHFRVCATVAMSFKKSTAPSSSRRGTVTFLSGDTFDFEHTSVYCCRSWITWFHIDDCSVYLFTGITKAD